LNAVNCYLSPEALDRELSIYDVGNEKARQSAKPKESDLRSAMERKRPVCKDRWIHQKRQASR
jgi:hypothetical protein